MVWFRDYGGSKVYILEQEWIDDKISDLEEVEKSVDIPQPLYLGASVTIDDSI